MKAEVRELTDALAQVFKSIHQRSYYKMEDRNLYPGQPKLLALIKKHEGITQKELSRINFVTPATITGMLNKLEASHFVYRVPDETDKRIMRVYLTPEGRSFAEKSECFMTSMLDQLFDGFSDEELHFLLAMAKKLKDNLDNVKL
jgi:DNA-binding MarR family transcriptional regulator